MGQKDVSRSVFRVWEDLLFTSLRGRPGALGSNTSSSLGTLADTVMDFGDNDLLVAGVAENLLSLRYLDINMAKTSAMLDTLGSIDW